MVYKPDIYLELKKNLYDTNKLSLNVPKCEFLSTEIYQFLAKMTNLRILINNEPLWKVSVSKYLGLYIDENLKLDEPQNLCQDWNP